MKNPEEEVMKFLKDNQTKIKVNEYISTGRIIKETGLHYYQVILALNKLDDANKLKCVIIGNSTGWKLK